MKQFCKECEKKIILETSDAWSMSCLSQRPSNPVTQCIILTIVRFQNGFGPIVKAKKPRLPQLQYQNHQIVHCTYLLQVSTWALKHYTNDSRLQRKLLVCTTKVSTAVDFQACSQKMLCFQKSDWLSKCRLYLSDRMPLIALWGWK